MIPMNNRQKTRKICVTAVYVEKAALALRWCEMNNMNMVAFAMDDDDLTRVNLRATLIHAGSIIAEGIWDVELEVFESVVDIVEMNLVIPRGQ